MIMTRSWVVLGACVILAFAAPAFATPFTFSYLDGGSWNTVYAQGFSPSVSPNPNPGLVAGDPVFLKSFEFFKSGTADNLSNIRLVILNNIFGDITGLTTSSGLVEGVSNNTIASTAPLATGDSETFTFSNLPLIYGNNYAAVAANIDGSGNITPVRISALTANYVEVPPGSGTFHPQTNYGTESQFIYATSNATTVNQFGTFFNTFSFAGDANFRATFSTVPEPATAMLTVASILLAGGAGRRRRRTECAKTGMAV
jgi:hypothetical protein